WEGDESAGDAFQCGGAGDDFIGSGATGEEAGSWRIALHLFLIYVGGIRVVIPDVVVCVSGFGNGAGYRGLGLRETEEEIGNIGVDVDFLLLFGGFLLALQEKGSDDFEG